jgi:hypothetical protein
MLELRAGSDTGSVNQIQFEPLRDLSDGLLIEPKSA